MYLGSLETVFPLVTELLTPDGLFAFSVEDAGEGNGFVLRESMRYAHAQDYILGLLQAFGFELIASEKTVIRMDGGSAIHGILFLSRKAA
jgi:predicted TPR repeat methyltransferase